MNLNWTETIFELIDMRSFSNLWYWIALAVTWSTASHWVLGVPYDMIMRARRRGGQAAEDLEMIVQVNVNRLVYISTVAGLPLVAFVSFALTTLAVLGFYYRIEFCQAVMMIAFPMTFVGMMSMSTARKIDALAPKGEALHKMLLVHRVWVQAIGMISIFVTAFWGMLQNMSISVISG